MMVDDSSIHVLISTDHNYIMPVSVLLKSVSVNNLDNPVVFHIQVDQSVTEEDKRFLNTVITCNKHILQYHLMDRNLFKDYPSLGSVKKYLTQTTYYRLFATDVVKESINKILYLDGDIINCMALTSLWRMDLSGYALGAVTDMAENLQDFNRLGYSCSEGYFNAGVLLINLDYWREHHLKEQFLKLIAEEPERIILHDQDVLNIVLHDKKLRLPMCYNVQNGFLWKPEFNQFGDRYKEYEADLLQAITHPVLIHFTDGKKPWHVEDCNPYGYEFMKYYKQTPWKYTPLGHCNRSKVRYWGSKILRSLNLLGPSKTDEHKYYSIEELQTMKNQYSK